MKKHSFKILTVLLVFIMIAMFFSKIPPKISTELLSPNRVSSIDKSLGKELANELNIISKKNRLNEFSENSNVAEKSYIDRSAPRKFKFDSALEYYLNFEFGVIPITAKESKKSSMVQSKRDWALNYLSSGEVLYRSDYKDELSASKMTLFFNYYQCEASSLRICFQIYIYNFRSDNWYIGANSGSEDNIRWKNNAAYIVVSLSNLDGFTRLTNAWYLLVPLPRDNMPLYYIKYESNKFSLEKGPESDWVLTTKESFEKFANWANDYKIKHGETPDL